MANLMGVTNPVPGYDGPNNNRAAPVTVKPSDTTIQNITDPTRVVRPDGRTDQKGADDALQSNTLRYDSNLQFFVQSLRDAPDLAAELTRVVGWMHGLVAAPGLTEGVAGEMKAFLQQLQLDGEGLRQFFLSQMASGNRFTGPLLSLLRQAYQHSNSDSVRENILGFLKRYSDFSSTGHIGRTISQILHQLPDYIPKRWGDPLRDLTARWENGFLAGTRGENVKLLQGEVIPLLANYVERTHDMGMARTLISLLTLNLTRYENGDEQSLLLAFRQLGNCSDHLASLNQLDDNAILKLLRENDFTRAVAKDAFSLRLANLASYALKGECGTELRDAFTEIVRAMLLNESVYMPLRHGLVPLQWENRMMYSEYWVDPDAERGKGQPQEEGKVQFLFKMDIQDLGFLEMTLGAQNGQVDLAVYGPPPVAANTDIVSGDLRQILEDHGLTGRSVRVLHEEKPLAITDVFPDLFEGERSVNVKV